MPSPSWENLDDFLADDAAGGFAVPAAIYLYGVAQPRIVTGIYDDPYLNAQLGEYEADTSEPRFTCKETDVVGVKRGDYWQQLDSRTRQPVGPRLNIMTEPQSDGTGMAILRMEPL